MHFAMMLASACFVAGSLGLGLGLGRAAPPSQMYKLKASHLITQAPLPPPSNDDDRPMPTELGPSPKLPTLLIDNRAMPTELGPGSKLLGGVGTVPFCVPSNNDDCIGTAWEVANLGRNLLEVCPSDGANALPAEAVQSRHLVAVNPDQARNRCGHSMILSYGNYQVQVYIVGSCKNCNKDEILITSTHRVFSPIRFYAAELEPGNSK
ncbi:MAG: hypothetical protein M1826_005672 [Phylliscum demangeonii]|nr:MAG: hypothetical protein M1826_005672 [Phylliscum demangeonii]